MEYVRVGEDRYEATVFGLSSDPKWGGRATKRIRFKKNEISYAEIFEKFTDGAQWAIVSVWDEDVIDPDSGEPTGELIHHEQEFDNSEYHLAGPVSDNRDGTFEVYMGRLTELEQAYQMILGGTL